MKVCGEARTQPEGRPGSSPALISIRGISRRFQSSTGQEVLALDGVSCEIRSSTFVSLVGPSGCGKTTLLSIIAGLESCDAGQVVIGGAPVAGPRDDIGMAFQSAVLLPWRTVLQNVLLPVEIRYGGVERHRDKARGLVEMVGLGGFEHHLPHELSGGMQQRAAIARALILDPDILLLDEPFGALDALTREGLNVELARIWQARRQTAVLVTHNISEAVFLSDWIVVMSPRPGKVVQILPVPLDRPRGLAIMETNAFNQLVGSVRSLLMR